MERTNGKKIRLITVLTFSNNPHELKRRLDAIDEMEKEEKEEYEI